MLSPCVCRVCVCAGVGLAPLKGLPSPARPLPFVLAQELAHPSPQDGKEGAEGLLCFPEFGLNARLHFGLHS